MYNVTDIAPSDDVKASGPPRLRVEHNDMSETPDLFPGSVAGPRAGADAKRERAKPTSLAALEEEVMRELREQTHSAEKAALLSSVLEEEV